MKMDGMPSGPGIEEDLILSMARFNEMVSKSGRGGMENCDWSTLGGTERGLERGGSKEDLKWVAKSCVDSSTDVA